MALHWLDLARYADTNGYHIDNHRDMWKWREWVIDAFNQDLPYDQFIRLQLAADKIEGTNSPNLAALGFLGLGPKYYNRNRLEVMADEWEDRVDVVSRTMLESRDAIAFAHGEIANHARGRRRDAVVLELHLLFVHLRVQRFEP